MLFCCFGLLFFDVIFVGLLVFKLNFCVFSNAQALEEQAKAERAWWGERIHPKMPRTAYQAT